MRRLSRQYGWRSIGWSIGSNQRRFPRLGRLAGGREAALPALHNSIPCRRDAGLSDCLCLCSSPHLPSARGLLHVMLLQTGPGPGRPAAPVCPSGGSREAPSTVIWRHKLAEVADGPTIWSLGLNCGAPRPCVHPDKGGENTTKEMSEGTMNWAHNGSSKYSNQAIGKHDFTGHISFLYCSVPGRR